MIASLAAGDVVFIPVYASLAAQLHELVAYVRERNFLELQEVEAMSMVFDFSKVDYTESVDLWTDE